MLKDARIKWNIVIIVQKLFSRFEYNVISLNHNNRRLDRKIGTYRVLVWKLVES